MPRPPLPGDESSSESNVVLDSAPLSEISQFTNDEPGSGIASDSEKVLPQPRQWKALTPSGLGLAPLHLSEESSTLPPATHGAKVSLTEAGQSLNFSEFLKNMCRQLEDSHQTEVCLLIDENTRLLSEIEFLRFQRHEFSSCAGEQSITSLSSANTQQSTVHHKRGLSSSTKTPQGSYFSEMDRASKKSAPHRDYSSEMSRGSKKNGSKSRLASNSFIKRFQLLDEWQVDDARLEEFASDGNFETELSQNSQRPSFELRKSSGAGSSNILQSSVCLHPENTFRLAWDLTAAFLLAYDTVMLPLNLFEIKATTTTKVMEWLTAIFWTLDVPASLSTGVFVKGRLEMSYKGVYKQYARTWMVPDLVLVLMEWGLILLSGLVGHGAHSSVGAIRNVRTLRFVRLVRLVKFESLITQLNRRINSIYLLLSLRIVRMVLALLVANHLLASTWYAIGVSGWVEEEQLETDDVLYCYLTSYHWSLTQFHGSMEIAPSSAKERFFAVLVLLSALVAFSWFLSSMTNSMIMLQNIHQERSAQQRSLLAFLSQRPVSKALAVRIKEYITSYEKENPAVIQEKEVALFSLLPRSLMADLHAEIRGRRFIQHPLFYQIYEKHAAFLRQMLHEAVEEIYASRNDILFSTSEACNRMLFVNSKMGYAVGKIKRKTTDDEERPLFGKSFYGGFADDNPGGSIFETPKWLCEPVLWTNWVHCGILTALEDACMYALQSRTFLRQIVLYKEVRLYATVYAKEFVDHLAERPTLTDLPECVDVRQVWDICNQKIQSMLSMQACRTSVFSTTAIGRRSIFSGSANSGLFRR